LASYIGDFTSNRLRVAAGFTCLVGLSCGGRGLPLYSRRDLCRLYPRAIVVLAGHLDPLEQFIDFRASFFVFMFPDLFGKLVELL
jgi:hypothetical protein